MSFNLIELIAVFYGDQLQQRGANEKKRFWNRVSVQPQIWHLVIISNSQSEVHICLFAIGNVNMLLTKKGLIVADNGKQPLFTVSCW